MKHVDKAAYRRPAIKREYRLLASHAVLFGCACLLALATPSHAQGQPTGRPPLSIPIFLGLSTNRCFEEGESLAIKRLTAIEQDRINRQGGVDGRQLQLRYLDSTVENMRMALADPHTLAMIGLKYAALGFGYQTSRIFKELGADIEASAIPLLADLPIGGDKGTYQKRANIFSIRASRGDERVQANAIFVKAIARRPAIVSAEASSWNAKALKDYNGDALFVADHRVPSPDFKLDQAALAAAIADLKAKDPDLVVLNVSSSAEIPQAMSAFMAAGLTPPVFGWEVLRFAPRGYPGDIFQLLDEGKDLPHVYWDRLRQRIVRNGLDRWLFAAAKNPEAPGWASGKCQPRAQGTVPDVFDRDNMKAIRAGAQYADLVALVAEAVKSADPNSDTAALRAHLLTQLKTTYALGSGAFRGSYENWSFRGDTRAPDPPFIMMRRHGAKVIQLAPIQLVRLKTDKLRPIDTLYLDIDLIRAFRVDDNDKSFFADFYLSMRGKNASINQIEFDSAFLDPKTNDRQISVRTLHDGSASEFYPDEMQVYRVSGKFMFDPRLSNYPFDSQRFAINIQPKRGSAFIVQPPPHFLRDRVVDADGWHLKEHFVSYDADFVPTIDAWTMQTSIVPFYKTTFVWHMKREATDYYLRVVVPLAFILLVAYLSIFIPRSNFEAIVTIQVTALLSAVALYLALPKLDADSTTISDKIFLFMYLSVTLMVGLSIFRITPPVVRLPWLGRALAFIHIVLIPAMVGGAALYLYRVSLGEG